MKTCTKCGETKPLGQFRRDKRAKDGRSSQCKECRTKQDRSYYAQNKEAVLKQQRDYYQRNRDSRIAYQRQNYARNRDAILEQQKDYYQRNRDAILERQRDYRGRNLKKIRATKRRYWNRNAKACRGYSRAYRRRHPERTKAAARAQYRKQRWRWRQQDRRRRALIQGAEGSHTEADIIRIWHRQRGECFYCGSRCGKQPTDTAAYHVEHLLPLSRGGSDWPRNLAIACPDCNREKNSKTVAEYRLYLIRSACHEA